MIHVQQRYMATNLTKEGLLRPSRYSMDPLTSSISISLELVRNAESWDPPDLQSQNMYI